MKKVLICILLLVSSKASAQNKCPLNVNNPAISHQVLQIKGNVQGVTQYNNPSEWVFLSYQEQWRPSVSLIPANDTTGHIHFEPCLPYNAIITGKLTIPFQVQFYQNVGTFYSLAGEMISDVIWDPVVPTMDPNLVIYTGILTLNPFIGDWNQGNTNIHHPAIHGWTNFNACIHFIQANGDDLNMCASMPLYTILDPNWPEQTDLLPTLGTNATVTTHRDPSVQSGNGSVWGNNIISVDVDVLPLLKPFNTRVEVPSMSGYSYSATGPLQSGIVEMKRDVDLHHGIPGTLMNSTGDYLDPTEITLGKHRVFSSWHTSSPAGGHPGLTAPNEDLFSILVVNTEIGDSIEPPVETCQDNTANNFGQPLPCTYPVPLDWHTITGILQRLNDQIRVCDLTDNKCLVLGIVQ